MHTCQETQTFLSVSALYQVNSLGMNFSIPEYNTSLTGRKLQSPQPVTCMIPPHPYDGQSLRKSATQNINPSNHLTYQIPPRNVQSVPTRGLQRGYTHAPKLFSDDANEEPFKGVRKVNNIATNSDNKLVENSVAFHNGKTKLSLPRIGADMNSRSLTLSQF